MKISKQRLSQNPSDKPNHEAGYSLLEILVVLAIIATLMTLVAPRLMGNLDKSKKIAAKAQAKTLRLALDSYKLDTGRYPSASEGLAVLVNPPAGATNWFGPYLDGELPIDPWDNAFIYEPPQTDENGRTTSPKVISLGADKAVGGVGNDEDISS